MATLGLNPLMQNPFLQSLSSLLHPAAAPPWGPQLSNKAVASMWNYNDAKRMAHQHEEEEVKNTNMYTVLFKLKNQPCNP